MQSKERFSIKKINWEKYIVYVAFVFVFLLFTILLKDMGFVKPVNLLNIMRQTAMTSVMAVAMTFVIATGQIDLSIGHLAGLCSLVVAMVLEATGNILFGVLMALIVGLVVGIINGLLITKLRIPAFLATLGMMFVIYGVAMWLTNTSSVPVRNDTFSFIFGTGSILGIPILMIWTFSFVVFGALLLNKTAYGKKVLATGGNDVAAKFTGIKTDRIRFSALVMSSIFAAFAGIMYAARLHNGRYSYGEGDEMTVIAAVVLGGTSMSGGSGSVVGALIGAMLMGMINNALILGGLSICQQEIVKGAIIILAVALSNIFSKKKR